jgi:hypothetical protein
MKVVWIVLSGLVAVGIVALIVVLSNGGSATVAFAPSTCTLGYDDHDVRVTLSGDGATGECSSWQGVDGNWHDATADITLDTTVCTGSYNGFSWTVVDDGGQMFGTETCASLNQWAHGGSLSIP